jgi:putative radical SAM enzyme (TIGR03279 family)
MRNALVSAVAPGSPAETAGVCPGDELLSVSGQPVRDVIEYRWLTDEPEVSIELRRGGLDFEIEVTKGRGVPLGMEVDSPVFDEVRTCDNHCEFCFIYQLPPGMRRSLHLKDDDYRLSFLYGNFTTLTRFTEADLERVLTEGLSPLYVSIHSTDPEERAEMLRNRRGATSLRWLRALLEGGVEVHGQVVVCPGRNDGDSLRRTLVGILDEYPALADVAVVPLGVSDHSTEAAMRSHTREEAVEVLGIVHEAQKMFLAALGRRMVFAADEYYLLAGQPFPDADTYGDFGMHEDGIGMARAFEAEFTGGVTEGIGVQPGFFSWVDGAPAEGYRAPRTEEHRAGTHPQQMAPAVAPGAAPATPVELRTSRTGSAAILTGEYGAAVLRPLLEHEGFDDVRIVAVPNQFFGGNIAVTGLMVGADVSRALRSQPEGDRYLLPDVCLSRGVFLDGMSPEDLPLPVEVVPTDGVSLRRVLEAGGSRRG